MANIGDYEALTVDGEPVSLRDLIAAAKYAGKTEFVELAVEAALLRRAARELDIEATAEDLQEAANTFRKARGLYNAQEAQAWLTAHHLSMEEWQAGLEFDVLTRKVREAVTEKKIEPHFAQHLLSFEHVTLSQILVKDEHLARELLAQVAEEDADFHALARRYSTDAATRPAGGYLGIVRRGELPAAVQAAVFGARPGETAGPFETREGWQIVRVESVRPAVLDEETREEIRRALFAEWRARVRENARVGAPLMALE